MAQTDWHRLRMELTAPRECASAAEGGKGEPGDRRSRSIPDRDSTDALLEHIALALGDRGDLSS